MISDAEFAELKMQFDKQFDELEKKIDGSDGRPPFRREEIIKFAEENSFYPEDPLTVYKKKHIEKLIEWEAKKEMDRRKQKKSFSLTKEQIKRAEKDGRRPYKWREIEEFIVNNPQGVHMDPLKVYNIIHGYKKIKPKSMPELKPGSVEPKSANPLPLLWASIKYLFHHPLARNIIIAIVLVAVVIVGGNYLLAAKLPADKVSILIKDDKGNVVIDSTMDITLVNIYSNLVNLKARFQIDENNQVGNISQYIQEEIAKQLQQKGL